MSDPRTLGPWLRRFLTEHIVTERNLARNTQMSYRDTFTLLLPFVGAKSRKPVDRIAVHDLTPRRVLQFLAHLEDDRGCSVQTRNQRLTAIRAFDEMRGRRRLGHPLLAHAAGVLRSYGDDDAKLGGDDVEPLGAVLADARHLPATARTLGAVGFEHLLDAWQVLGQMAEVAPRVRALRTRRRRGARRGRFLGLGECAFERLEGKLELVGMELLGLLGEHRAAQLTQQMFEASVVLGE